MNIYLLRHGETDWNHVGRLQGHTDIPLNECGREQMGHVAEVLAGLSEQMDVIISSPLRRARESAYIVANRLTYPQGNIVVEPMLIERCFGEGEGLTVSERNQKYPDGILPGKEPLEDLLSRARTVFEKVVTTYQDKENILLAGHGSILYAVVTAVTDGRIEYGGKKVTFDQGSFYRIRCADGILQLERYGEEETGFKEVIQIEK